MDIKRVMGMPPRTVVRKGVRKIKRSFYYNVLKIHDRFLDTRSLHREHRGLLPIPINIERLDFTAFTPERAQVFWDHYKRHEFDLLGSGWVSCGYLDNAPGFEGRRYPGFVLDTDLDGLFLKRTLPSCCQKRSVQIWRMIEGPYQGIDWQKDFKSGYRWEAKDWYWPLRLAEKEGGDIKVPWELGRLQHLPRLALFYHILPKLRADIFKEYCNQLLDFAAQNPVRWGVQSMCPMDMGIRVANIVLSYSLFAAQGAAFSKDIQDVIEETLYDTCSHIFQWSDEFTNNHYLADLGGLLYGSCLLHSDRCTNRWKRVADKGLLREFSKQFYEEGSNKEGSSFYHRLSSDIMGWCLALIVHMEPETKIDIQRLEGTKNFLQALIRPDGLMTAVGDNDSGLFFHLSLTGVGEKEQPNDVHATVSVLGAFFEGMVPESGYRMEHTLLREFLPSVWGLKPMICVPPAKSIPEGDIISEDLEYQINWNIPAPGNSLLQGIRTISFQSFGIYVFRSDRLYLCFNLSDNGQNGNGGHAHNDKLSFELFIDGKAIYEDPGTYVYTASEKLRDQYRSVKAHDTLYAGIEQNDFRGMFSMADETTCRVYGYEENSIKAEVRYKDVICCREIRIEENTIQVKDFCNKEFVYLCDEVLPCRGYGIR